MFIPQICKATIVHNNCHSFPLLHSCWHRSCWHSSYHPMYLPNRRLYRNVRQHAFDQWCDNDIIEGGRLKPDPPGACHRAYIRAGGGPIPQQHHHITSYTYSWAVEQWAVDSGKGGLHRKQRKGKVPASKAAKEASTGESERPTGVGLIHPPSSSIHWSSSSSLQEGWRWRGMIQWWVTEQR